MAQGPDDTVEDKKEYQFQPGKSCRVCSNVKAADQFYKNSNQPDKLDSRCKLCEKVRRKVAYHEQYELETFNRFRQRCKMRGIAFELTLPDIPKVPSHCPILGTELVINWGGRAQSNSSPTLDKIDPSLGYVKGNVAWMSSEANRMKSNHTIDSLENLLAWMKGKLK